MTDKSIPIDKFWLMSVLSSIILCMTIVVKEIDTLTYFTLDSYLQNIPIPIVLTLVLFISFFYEFKKLTASILLHVICSMALFFAYTSLSVVYVGFVETALTFFVVLVVITFTTPKKDKFLQIYTDF